MIPDFMIRAALAGLGVVAAAGPLGGFVVWRRMAYFGDATAHASLLGVALALGLGINLLGGVLAVAVLMALGLAAISGRGIGADTALGVMAHGALAAGLVGLSLFSNRAVNIETYLFGDILAVRWSDLAWIWGGALTVLGVIAWRWQAWLTTTLSPDLAASEGIDPRREQMLLTLTLAIVVAVAIKVVGALLITAMMIVPAAAARSLSRTPEVMAAGASIAGVLAVVGGLWLAWELNSPAGPSIVCVAVALFALSRLRQPPG